MPSILTLRQALAEQRSRGRLIFTLARVHGPKLYRMLLARRRDCVQAWRDSTSVIHTEMSLVNLPWEQQLLGLYLAGAQATHERQKTLLIVGRKATAPALSTWIDRNIAVRVSQTTMAEREAVRKIINNGLARGQSVGEIALQLEKSRLWTDKRADRVARTELNSAINAAIFFDTRSLGLQGLEKNWIAIEDDRVREAHSTAHSTQTNVPIDKPFIVGGYQMMFPGDASLGAPAAQIVNCRCTVSMTLGK